MKKIIFVSHCILNTASKVVLYNQEEIESEEALRIKFLNKAIAKGIQIIQLPCPEFSLYGAKRWGHVSNQFDNVFFRKHCRNILTPIIDQMKEYLNNNESYEILGVIGIDGSPSCGVDYTCIGDWYGSFESRTNLNESLSTAKLVSGKGILMDELNNLLIENNLIDKIKISSLFASEEYKCLDLLN